MKSLAKAALAALLVTVAGGAIVAEPVAAQKKGKNDKAGPQISPDLLKAAQTAQTALNANDLTTAEPAIAQMEAGAKTDDDRYYAASFRFDLERKRIAAARQANPNGRVDESRLAGPMDALLASPRTPPQRKGELSYFRGIIAYQNKQYPQALQFFTQAQQLGYNAPDLGLQLVRTREASGDAAGTLSALDAELQRQVAAGQKPTEDLYRYGLARAIKQPGQALPWMERYLRAYPSPKTWRDVLLTYGLSQGSVAQLDNPQKIDLFRLMRATNSLADQYDYLDYAQKLRDRGLPAEAEAVIQEGLSAGKIPAANTEAKAMLTEVRTAARNEGSLASLETRAKAAADGKLAVQTGDAYLSQGNYAKAAELYRAALGKGTGVNADEVNTRLGIALAKTGDKAGAKAAFAAVKTAPRQGLAQLWTVYVDQTPA